MIRRILTAVVLIPLILALVLRGSVYMMVALELAIILAALWEYLRLARAALGVPLFPRIAYGAGCALGLLALSDSIGRDSLALLLLYSFVLLVLGLRSCRNLSDYLCSAAASVFGVIYAALPLSLLVWTWRQARGPVLVLFLLLVVWTGDTSAFFIGKAFGRHKLAPRISPGKTWEGFWGGLILAAAVGLLFEIYFWKTRNMATVVMLAVALNLAGQAGDLAESAMKRSAGVKDSSQLVPGHGGILDRIDALLFAAPILWYYQVLFPG